nr:hypothetical protein [Micromonospora sp. DSM 115978]
CPGAEEPSATVSCEAAPSGAALSRVAVAQVASHALLSRVAPSQVASSAVALFEVVSSGVGPLPIARFVAA